MYGLCERRVVLEDLGLYPAPLRYCTIHSHYRGSGGKRTSLASGGRRLCRNQPTLPAVHFGNRRDSG